MEIPRKIKDEIWDYCRLNDITDIDGFMVKMIQQGYNIEKYGNAPVKLKEPEVIEKEVIKEVQVIREVEKIVEVPVEKIIEVIKEVEKPIQNTEYINELLSKIQQLEYRLGQSEKSNMELQNSNDLEHLNRKIENLQIQLELEKNRNKELPKPKIIEEPKKGRLNNIIRWVSKSDEEDDIYNEN